MKFIHVPFENLLDTNPYVHYLQEGDLLKKSNKEIILKHLHELPRDFMEMTLFDIDGCGSIYTFSHIITEKSDGAETISAIFKKL
ncbi:hypothetical protein [Metabacillus malikii]|uniref:Uncharacterized protein n=1 Tax=Metabacillus malikii TaxID=1504265 RepID=A0ABT9ZCQ1_9BACI|nr:hypothetical protein [Metabacillus malikii]MDQ0230037.1 hypothetical protein [Metabacillus malikii]